MSAFASAFTRSTWKVRNLLRYDKLNLVKSFLFTLASRRSYLRLLDKRCSRSKTSCSIRAKFRFYYDTFCSGHFAIIRLLNGRRLICAFDRISENLRTSSYLLNLTDFRSYYCYPKRNRTVKSPKRKLLMTLIMRLYAHTHVHTDYVLHLTYTNRWINFVQDTHRYTRADSRDWT